MMKAVHERFRINAPRVVSQTVDHEAIIIDFENGAYFSAEGLGAEIWEGIAGRNTVEGIFRNLRRRYTGEESDITSGVLKFLDELQREGLIVPCEAESEETGPPAEFPSGGDGATLPYLEPRLRKYTDMQDLLLLDPIHDVDPQGWPIAKDADGE